MLNKNAPHVINCVHKGHQQKNADNFNQNMKHIYKNKNRCTKVNHHIHNLSLL